MSYFYETDSDEEKKPRKLNKKNCGKPPKKMIIIKNPDKVGHEEWDKNHIKDLCNFPSPIRASIIGPCGCGKSLIAKQIVLHARPKYQEVILIHQDAEMSREYDDLECTEKLSEVPDLSYWDYEGPHVKRLCIIDDLELSSAHKERIRNLCIMFRYASTHKGLSIVFCHQSWFDILPLIKKMSNVFIIFKPRAQNEITMIENRCGYPKHTFQDIFKTICPGFFDSICVDLTRGTPAPLRKNIWEKIEMEESDEED